MPRHRTTHLERVNVPARSQPVLPGVNQHVTLPLGNSFRVVEPDRQQRPKPLRPLQPRLATVHELPTVRPTIHEAPTLIPPPTPVLPES